MSRLRWAKFFWADWANDTALNLCSLPARGLWMALLCVAAQGEPYGYVTVGGKPPSRDALFRLACPPGTRPRQFDCWLAELERHGVARRTETGILYSLRMVHDAARSKQATKAAHASHSRANHEPLVSQSRANHEPRFSAQTRRNGQTIVAGADTEAEADRKTQHSPTENVEPFYPDDATETRVVRLNGARASRPRPSDAEAMQRLYAMAQEINDRDD